LTFTEKFSPSLIFLSLASMSLQSIFADLSLHLQSAEFCQSAIHPDHPTAFTRQRKLPLQSLVSLLLSGMRKSVQAELDEFFAHLRQQAQLLRYVSEQAFAQARSKLSITAIPRLNDWVIERAQHYGFVSRWHGLRLVAVDASTMRFGLRASRVLRAALPDQIAFGLFLPGCELTLATSLHSIHENERQMLFEQLDRLGSSDLLLLDRGYPCRWLVAALNQRAIPFCMRVEKSGSAGFTCVREFLRTGLTEQVVTLRAADRRDVRDFGCPSEPQTVRLVRHIAPNGRARVLMTNLFDKGLFPASRFGDLYHQRWRIEEAYKRLKHWTYPDLTDTRGLDFQLTRCG
jgi:Transposase DDE domain